MLSVIVWSRYISVLETDFLHWDSSPYHVLGITYSATPHFITPYSEEERPRPRVFSSPSFRIGYFRSCRFSRQSSRIFSPLLTDGQVKGGCVRELKGVVHFRVLPPMALMRAKLNLYRLTPIPDLIYSPARGTEREEGFTDLLQPSICFQRR